MGHEETDKRRWCSTMSCRLTGTSFGQEPILQYRSHAVGRCHPSTHGGVHERLLLALPRFSTALRACALAPSTVRFPTTACSLPLVAHPVGRAPFGARVSNMSQIISIYKRTVTRAADSASTVRPNPADSSAHNIQQFCYAWQVARQLIIADAAYQTKR